MPAPTSRCGVAARRSSTRSTAGSTATTCPSCACRAPSAPRPTRPRPPRGADIVVLAVPSQTLRANLTAWGSALPASAAVVSLMKGVELGTTKRMSEVIAEVGGVETERIVIVSGPNLAREIAVKQPAASVVASASAQMAELVAGGLRGALLPPVHGIRRRRHRDLRRREERHRAGRRHGRGPGHGRQLQGVDHHPRPRRDDAPGHGARRRRRHLRRARRGRRPHRHLHVAAVAQPLLRGAARARGWPSRRSSR